jgi:glutathione synthase/RimK-type ligase-like ATP-grasp enzyme
VIACLYGRDCAPFVEPVVRDLCAAAAAAGGELQPLTIEAAVADSRRCADVHRLYILPFDPPPSPAMPVTALIRALFPRAEIVTSVAVQDLCWDNLTAQERLFDRGLPVPETLLSSEPAAVRDFVHQHGFAVLKERYSCAGEGHVVLWMEDDQLVGDAGSHQCRIELTTDGRRQLRDDCLVCPAPFYVQRLVADIGPRGVSPGQILRAYIADGQIVFWTERYRPRCVRPADWIITAGRGAKYRFLHDASEEAKKIALRSAEVIGMRFGAVDLLRTGSSGPYVLDLNTDGYHMFVDRQFKQIPEYREFFDFDRYIGAALVVEPEAPKPRADESSVEPPSKIYRK